MAQYIQKHLPKYYDIGASEWDKGGRQANYWLHHRHVKVFNGFRKGSDKLPDDLMYYDHVYLSRRFSIGGFEFGEWLTQEDRLNYVCALGISLYDLGRVLKIPNDKIGLKGQLKLSMGARGRSGALAHFEPWSFIINIVRHDKLKGIQPESEEKRKQKKLRAFLSGGGVGTLAHEYGHALDYYVGLKKTPGKDGYLSRGRDTSAKVDLSQVNKRTSRGLMEKLHLVIAWGSLANYKKNKPSNYFQRMAKDNERSGYTFRRTEIFSRIFEQYFGHVQAESGTQNSFLSWYKYDDGVYLNKQEQKRLYPIMKKLVTQIIKDI